MNQKAYEKAKEYYAARTSRKVSELDEYDLYVCKVAAEYNKAQETLLKTIGHMRTDEEKHKMIDLANEAIEEGKGNHLMSYEDGVIAALMWEMGTTDEEPMEED